MSNQPVRRNNLKDQSKKSISLLDYWGSTSWADSQLRGLTNLLWNDSDSWEQDHSYHNKIIVGDCIVERLRIAGFEWHSNVAKGHLHRWMKRNKTRRHGKK